MVLVALGGFEPGGQARLPADGSGGSSSAGLGQTLVEGGQTLVQIGLHIGQRPVICTKKKFKVAQGRLVDVIKLCDGKALLEALITTQIEEQR